MILRLSCSSEPIERGHLPDLQMELSSVKRDEEEKFKSLGKSLINILKRIGLITQPRGVPLEDEKGSE